MTNQHPKTAHPSDADLKRNPGIGQSGALNRLTRVDDVESDNTVEGDVANDTNRFGGIDPDHRGRANK
jgi:hypothetical protein